MNSITVTLDSRDGKHLYEQIYEYIKQEIKAGKLLYNEKLPSTRSLAEYLQISRSTVDLAYEQLAAEGYIEAKPCRGYFVCHKEELYHLTAEVENGAVWQEEEREGYFVDFSTNAVDLQEFPFDTWRRIYRKVFSEQGDRLFLTGAGQGERKLRVMLSRYLHSSRGVDCEPEQIIIGAGNDYLLMLLEKLLNGLDTEGEEKLIRRVALENPTYRKAGRMFASFGYQITEVEMDAYGMCPDKLEESQANLAYVMPSHQFPTGTVMPIGRRMELLRWASESPERYLIEDDYDSEFRYKGKPIPALQSSDGQEKVIYLGTFSKSISPAIRISYLVLPGRLMQAYHKYCSYLSTTVQRTEQEVLAEFIGGGYFERHLNRMRKVYREKHDKMLRLLKPFETAFTISGENAGLHLLLTDKRGRTEEELKASAAKQGIRVYGMREFCMENMVKSGAGEMAFVCSSQERGVGKAFFQGEAATILLGYAGLTEQEIEEGLSLLAKIWL